MTATSNLNLELAAKLLGAEQHNCTESLLLTLPPVQIRIRSNSAALINQLRDYFQPVLKDTAAEKEEVQPETIELLAIDQPVIEHGLSFVDWKREPGKSGRKDAYLDFPQGRLVLKVRTGMLFLQSDAVRIAAGPCLQHDNQLINYINSQYMNWLQQRGWQIGHAAGLVHHGAGVAIAGFSGGGKSTLMLQLLEQEGMAYMTNDRLLISQQQGSCIGTGIAKWPRVNPGTMVHNPRLASLLSAQRIQELLALPAPQLWELEEKHDVFIDQSYGQEKLQLKAPVRHLLILNWQRNSQQPTQLKPVDLNQRNELLAAIMKSPGPFYQHPDGLFEQDTNQPDQAAYLDALSGVSVYEATGNIDFNIISNALLERL